MTDKQVKIRVGADVDDKQVKALEDLLNDLADKVVGFEVSVEDGELDSALEKEEELNTTAEVDIEVDDSAVQLSMQNIKEGFSTIKQSISEMGAVLTDSLESAGKQETNKAFLEQALGDPDKAKSKLQEINGIVQQLPGDDSVMQGLLGSAVAKDASLTTDELTKMGSAASDYFAAMKNYGKSSSEAFQDMNNYLMTGNTAEIERSPILANHIDKLKQATTIQERSQLLQEALNEEHWGGISAQDTYNNKLETFEGMLERGRYNLGGMFQEGAKGGMDFLLKLDESTNGIVGMGLAAMGFASPLTDMVMGMGQMATGMKAIKDLGMVKYLKELEITTKLSALATSISSAASAIYGTVVGVLTGEITLAEAATMAWNAVMAMNPIVLVVIALIALAAALIWAYQNVDWFREMVDNAWASIQVWGQQLYTFISGALAALMPAISAVGSWIIGNISSTFSTIWSIISGAMGLWNQASAKAREIANAIGQAFSGVKGTIQSAFSGVTNAITQPFMNAYNTVKPIIDSIKWAVDNMGLLGSSGISVGSVGSAGISMGSVNGVGSANTNIMNNTSIGGSPNITFNGIIEESAGEFIVRKINDEIYRQNVLRGV